MAGSDLFSIGASGVRAHQAAMGAIAENIANATTEGYSRRSVSITESPTSAATQIFYKSGTSFGGAAIGGVVRSNDAYLDSAMRNTGNLLANADQRARWTSDVQTAFNDTTLGVGQRMTGMFSAIEKLAANPTDTTLRTNVIFSFEQINTAFKQSSDDLKSIRTGIGQTAQNEVAALNTSLDQLASANEGLRRTADGSPAQAQLLDSRDQALLDISKHLNVSISFGANGVANVSYQGHALVDNTENYTATVTQAADGTLSLMVDGQATTSVEGGSLGGLAQSAVVTKNAIDGLDALARQYVTDVNGWHSGGYTDTGGSGAAVLSIGADAGTLSVLISDPASLAVRDSAGVVNGNLLAVNSIRGTGSVEQAWTTMIAAHGNLTSATLAEQTAATTRDQQAQQARADVSGVNLDREAAELLRLQQAYQASARVIQVARELTQTIFSTF